MFSAVTDKCSPKNQKMLKRCAIVLYVLIAISAVAVGVEQRSTFIIMCAYAYGLLFPIIFRNKRNGIMW